MLLFFIIAKDSKGFNLCMLRIIITVYDFISLAKHMYLTWQSTWLFQPAIIQRWLPYFCFWIRTALHLFQKCWLWVHCWIICMIIFHFDFKTYGLQICLNIQIPACFSGFLIKLKLRHFFPLFWRNNFSDPNFCRI